MRHIVVGDPHEEPVSPAGCLHARAGVLHINPINDRRGRSANRQEAIRKALNNALAMRPTKRPVTERQAKAWEAFRKAMGNDGYIVEYEGVNGIIDAMIAELLK